MYESEQKAFTQNQTAFSRPHHHTKRKAFSFYQNRLLCNSNTSTHEYTIKKTHKQIRFYYCLAYVWNSSAKLLRFICSRLNENDLKNARNSCERLINCAYRFVSKPNVPAGQIAQL